MRWWNESVIYEIYVRSFADGSGDGIGDLPGLVQRLPYLAWLGVDVLWLSPVYPSPMRDFGYDVRDFTDIDPLFGSLADMDLVIEEAHRRGLRIVLDLVANHTSNEHPWFLRSRASRTSAQRDWYVWRDPASDGGPPNNWQSVTGGSAWTYDEWTGQYYLHSFLPFQPDLNWRNPDVRDAMKDVMRFWLDRGVDGFRIDMVDFLVKDAQFRDEPPNPHFQPDPDKPWYSTWYQNQHIFSSNHPDNHAVIKELRALLDSYGDRVAIGELDIHASIGDQVAYLGDGDELHVPFNFGLVPLPFTAEALRTYVDGYEAALAGRGWPNYTLGNHDLPRIASRLGADGARLAMMLLLTLRGTPTLYYGDELGMVNVSLPEGWARDPWEERQPGSGREPARSPMPWDAGGQAGFSTAEPWLPIGVNGDRPVAAQAEDPASPLSLCRALLAIRRATPALTAGSYRAVDAGPGTFAYVRDHGEQAILVALRLADTPGRAPFDHAAERATPPLVLATTRRGAGAAGELHDRELRLRPWEGVVVDIGAVPLTEHSDITTLVSAAVAP